jgi:hypothetical protein
MLFKARTFARFGLFFFNSMGKCYLGRFHIKEIFCQMKNEKNQLMVIFLRQIDQTRIHKQAAKGKGGTVGGTARWFKSTRIRGAGRVIRRTLARITSRHGG